MMEKKGVSYSTSSVTRRSLIRATGILIGQYGGLERVTTREIARLANTTTPSIKYHFGGKAGLLRAVFGIVLNSEQGLISSYLAEHAALLDTPVGQRRFLIGMLDDFVRFFIGERDEEEWIIQLRGKITGGFSHSFHDIVVQAAMPDIAAFCWIHHRITGEPDNDRAYFLFLQILLPLFLRLTHHGKVKRINETICLSDDFDKRYLAFCKEQLLDGVGLDRDFSEDSNFRISSAHRNL